MPFASLGLSPALARAATELGFTAPTPIQTEAIPAVLRGADVWASAQTGSGKTAAFALPALQRHQDAALSQRPGGGARRVHTLVIAPTRELAEILALLPPNRQSLFFSATFADEVQTLASALLHDPLRIEVAAEPETRPDITQRAIEVDAPKRAQLLRHLIQSSDWGTNSRVLVFAATKYATELVAHKLHRAGIHAAAFHGDLSQGARRAALAAFKANEVQVLVATDVAARGIDIVGLPVVVNFDLPRSPDDYIHRIGRTGRAGASGLAISFITPEAEAHFRLIEKRQEQRVPRERIADFEPDAPALGDDELPEGPKGLDPNGGVKGARKSKKDKLREAASDKG